VKDKGSWLIIIGLVITAGLFLVSKTVPDAPAFNFWQVLSQMSSLSGGVLLAITFGLSSRISWLEDWFGGLDKVYKKHHLLGGIAFSLLMAHPVLLAIKAISVGGNGLLYLLPSTLLPYNLGVGAVYGLILLLTFTLIIKLPYQSWLKTHQLMGLVALMAFGHVLLIDSDVARFWPLKLWMLGWMGLALAAVVYRKWLLNKTKTDYIVKKINQFNKIIEISLEAKNKEIKFRPGQFVFVSFKNKVTGEESHPFSIASAPEEKEIKLAIKMGGDYTDKLTGLKTGDVAEIIGPYGKMGEIFDGGKKIVVVAGGIGITPFLSMVGSEKEMTLFYSMRERNGYADDRLTKIKTNNFAYFPVYTSEKQRLTGNFIKEKIGNFTDWTFLVCGPEAMMTDIQNQLIDLGVDKLNIYYENFYLG
jgi:predicted ferric reductase